MISKTGGHGFKAVISAVCLIPAFALLISCAGCANFTKKEWTADPDALAKATETAGRNKLLIGCRILPRPHQMKDDESAEARMKEVAESGIEAMGAARELDLVIEAGDAKFVEFKTFAVDGN
ncbi:MAG: hypothetical protein J6X47_01835 [Clostridia bacterium]|nr:hypothetical protein [Clostridia bacterium]